MHHLYDELVAKRVLFSPDERYRYALHRRVVFGDESLPTVKDTMIFVMLNPSKADGIKDDATIRRCKWFALDTWSKKHLVVFNLFGLRSTDPKQLLEADDPVGPGHDLIVANILRSLGVQAHGQQGERATLVAAWGSGAWDNAKRHLLLKRLDAFTLELRKQQIEYDWVCLGATKHGMPRHPLYLPKRVQQIPWIDPRSLHANKAI